MSSELLSSIAGILLSLAFSYIPGLNTNFASLRQEIKRLIMAGLLLLVAGIVFGLSCTTWGASWGINITCDQQGFQALVASFISAVIANQAAYAISPLSEAVRQARVSGILEHCQEDNPA